MVLDVEPPRVISVVPGSSAVGVLTDTRIVVTFSEPIASNSISACGTSAMAGPPTFRLLESSSSLPVLNNPLDPCDDSNVVPMSVNISSNGIMVTLTPLRALKGFTEHTVLISRGVFDQNGDLVGGVRDLVGRPMNVDFTWQFVTRDDVPPRVLTSSPTNGAVNVAEESVIRVTFSEPIDPASINDMNVAVVGPAGTVMGQRDMIFGNSVLVFTPATDTGYRAFLEPNSDYIVTVSGVRDAAGNTLLPQEEVRVTFRTRDTQAPVIASLSAPPVAHVGESVLALATSTNFDVAAVKFFVDGVLVTCVFLPSATNVAQTPTTFEYRATLVMPERSVDVAVV